jgi:hypothetical protein
MPDPASPTEPDPATALRDLVDRLGTLEEEVAELRESLAREVRSRRIVVVEEDGFERIVLGARDRFGHVSVQSRTAVGTSTTAELFANDGLDGDAAEVGVALTDRGEVVSTLDVTSGRPPRLWVSPDSTEHT